MQPLIIQEIQFIFPHYNLGMPQTIMAISPGYSNQNYRIDTRNQTYLMRNNLEQPLERVVSELQIMALLKAADFPTSYPIARPDGNLLNVGQSGNFVLYEFLNGSEPQLNPQTVAQIGKATAQLNLIELPEALRRPNEIQLQDCLDLADSLPAASHQFPDIFKRFTRQLDSLKGALNEDLPKGLIHADIYPDNTLFDQNRLIGIIDFEMVCYDTLLLDVATSIQGFCYPDNRLDRKLMDVLLEAYTEHRPLSKSELDLLPVYIRWAGLGMLSWHLTRLIAEPNAHQQKRILEFLERLEA